MELTRCDWATKDSTSLAYHDIEWGVPLHNDQHLFELLTLEGAQAGLSWSTVLKRREAYREVFNQFNPEIVATWDDSRIAQIMNAPGIIHNRRKIASVIINARALLKVQAKFASFDRYLWDWVDGQPIYNHWQHTEDIPIHTPLSKKLSRDLKSRGFIFVGDTICYAYLQATGLVMDHITPCFRYHEITSSTHYPP